MLDLGSSPGGWSQVASKKIKNGKILAVDIIEMKNIKNVDFIKGDFKDEKIQKKIKLYFDKAVDIIVPIWQLTHREQITRFI